MERAGHARESAKVRRWLTNVATSYADLLVGGVVFFILTPILVRHFGLELYALWVIGHTITFYLGFLDLGLDGAHVRFHARLAARSRARELRALVATASVALTVTGAIAAALGALLAFSPLASWLEVSPALAQDLRIVLLVLAANLLVAFPASVFENVLEGAQRFDLSNARSIALRLVTATVQLVLLGSGYGIVALALVELAMSLVRLAVDFVLAARLLPGLARTVVRVDVPLWRRMRRFALWTSLDDVLVEGSAHVDKLLLAMLLPVALLTPYSLYVSVAGVLLLAVQPVIETFFPMAAALHGKRSAAALRTLVLDGTRTAMALALPAAVFLMFFGERALALWTPEAANVLPGALLPIVIVNLLVSVFLWTSTVVLMAANRVRALVLLTLAEVALEVLLMVFLSARFGVIGFALASLLANVIIGFGWQLPLLARHLGVSPRELLTHAAGRVGAAGLPALLVAWAMQSFLDEPGWLGLFLTALAIAGVYAAILTAFAPREHGRHVTLWRFLAPQPVTPLVAERADERASSR